MHRSHLASNHSSCPFLEYHFFSYFSKIPHTFLLNSTPVPKCTLNPASSYYPVFYRFFSYANYNLVPLTPNCHHLLASFYLCTFFATRAFIFENRIHLSLGCQSFYLVSSGLHPCPHPWSPLSHIFQWKKVKFIYCTEHCQAFNRMERSSMILVRCSQGITYRNEAPKRYIIKYKPLLYSVTDVILLHSKHGFMPFR